jgi:hypothetical protein
MSFLAWFNSLTTFRKSSGSGFEVPRLDSDGRIRVSSVSEELVIVSGSSPTNTDGSTLWNNTTSGEEGLYFYDQTRGKWLETAITTLPYGLDSADNAQFRPAGINFASVGSGYLVPQDITIVGVTAHATGGLATKGIDVRLNTVTQFSFNLAANNFSDFTLNTDIAGGAAQVLDIFAQAAGGAATDITVVLYVRRRAS